MRHLYLLLFSCSFLLASNPADRSLVSVANQVQPELIQYLAGGETEILPLELLETNHFRRTNRFRYQATDFELELVFINQGDYVECNGTLQALDSLPHCVTTQLAFPISKLNTFFWDKNIDDNQAINFEQPSYSEYVDVFTQLPPDGAFNIAPDDNGGYGDKVGTGRMSYYPLASISSPTIGYTWAVDMGLPLVYRLSVEREKGLVAEFDLGLSPQTRKFPNRAYFTLYLFKHDPQWGFRAALTSYYKLQADYFKKRVEHEGIWLPFTPLMTIDNWQDFGFGFHETDHSSRDNGVSPSKVTMLADRQAPEVYSFQYTEPWDIQIPIKALDLPYAGVVGRQTIPQDHLNYLAGSATLDKHGHYQARRLESPWFESGWAVSVTTNVDPELPAPNRYNYVRRDEIDPAIKIDVDGIYFDSMEWNWHHDLNYNRDHFQTADFPLTFSTSVDPPRPAIWNYSSEYEMMSQVAREMHAAGKLTMGNGFGWTPFAAGVLDLFGAEFSWYQAADYDSRVLQFRRSIAYQKPIVVLLNEGFSDPAFTVEPYDGYRVYFERMLFYGFFPSFFSADASNDPYWADAKNYNQGRPYFKKYIPLIQTIAAAGWEPITYASSNQADIALERFGDAQVVYFTLMNQADTDLQTRVTIDYHAIGLSKDLQATELVSDEQPAMVKVRRKTMQVVITVPANSTRLLAIQQH